MFAPPFQYTSMSYPSDFIRIDDHIINKQKITNISKENCNITKNNNNPYKIIIHFENTDSIVILLNKKEERDKLFEDIWKNCFRQVSE